MQLHVITGTTATGKTEHAHALAREINGEIINADARQIYKHLDIISGKDIEQDAVFHHIDSCEGFNIGYYQSAKDSNIPYWLYDAASPHQSCTAHDFRQMAQYVTAHIWRRGKIPILVGGSYFYLSAFLYDKQTYHVPADVKLREELKDTSVQELQRILATFHPIWLDQMNESDRMNPRRLVRKIEVAAKTERVPEVLQATETDEYSLFLKQADVQCRAYQYGSTAALQHAISERVQKRLSQGAIEEYKQLLHCGHDSTWPIFSTIGCREIQEYLDGKITTSELVSLWTTHEVQYAKRQLTFMKRDVHFKWRMVG